MGKHHMKKIATFLLNLVLVLTCITMAPHMEVHGFSYSEIEAASYNLKNIGSGKYLNVAYNANENNTNILVYAKDGTTGQEFDLVKSGDNYLMIPKCSPDKKVVNINGSSAKEGANIMLWQQTGHSTQQWRYEKVSNGYIVRSVNDANSIQRIVPPFPDDIQNKTSNTR